MNFVFVIIVFMYEEYTFKANIKGSGIIINYSLVTKKIRKIPPLI